MKKILDIVEKVVANVPADWVNLTTHRLDIYDESNAKVAFTDEFEKLVAQGVLTEENLSQLPTAYDYIRLGHPLSTVLEWALAQINGLTTTGVISFSSQTTPLLAVLRKNLFLNKNTRILYKDQLPKGFDADKIKEVYAYNFTLEQVTDLDQLSTFDGSTILVSNENALGQIALDSKIDFYVNLYEGLGSVLLVNGAANASYVGEIQHVRRRETIAMTPSNCMVALKLLLGVETPNNISLKDHVENKNQVIATIKDITEADTPALIASSGLSMQYAIMMGLVDYANENHSGKDIKIIVPPNCYGGTNDQARRVAACLPHVEVMDLPVDGNHDMVQSVEKVLSEIAAMDAVPYIIAEIPTNPRVEVPHLAALSEALSKERKTPTGSAMVAPVFILDQTFCPNVHFLGEQELLSSVATISYVSGSKFPSGGKCTAGYCAANHKGADMMSKIALHLEICDNEATPQQMSFLAAQMPSMNQRIAAAYDHTREFVNYIKSVLPEAKINFVSEELASQTFTPSVFSLDLPTQGNNEEEREAYKRALNLRLINMMITSIPDESKYCVSYGQLKGCYWTIPATSTQGTTKEGDKDYIVRVALSGNMDLEKHKAVFAQFVATL